MGRKSASGGARYVEDSGIRSLRIKTWFQAIAEKSGLTAAELERQFARGGVGERRSCIWDKYRRGEVEPRSDAGGDGLVERVERAYAGTAVWLSTPLWRLSDAVPMEMSDIRLIFEGIRHPLIRSIFVASKAEASGRFWRRPVDPDDAAGHLLRFEDLDALVALLAMVREAEIIQRQEQHWAAISAARLFLAWFCASGKIMPAPTGNDLNEYLSARWESPGYFSFDQHEAAW